MSEPQITKKQFSFPIEQLRKTKLMIGVPMYGGVSHMNFLMGLTNFTSQLTRLEIPHQVQVLANESLIPRARNYIADQFMRSNCTHLLFIDADIGFTVDDAMTAVGLCTPESEYDVVCGPYPKKCLAWEKIRDAVNMGAGDANPNNLENYVGDFVFNPVVNGPTEIRLDEPFMVSEAGTGFMLIQR